MDAIILPSITNPRELEIVRRKIRHKLKINPWFLVKIDNDKSCGEINSILKSADGVLVSRRHLAYSMSPAIVPTKCKEMIAATKRAAKLILLESDILGSMRTNHMPTRAEISDLANAVMDGADGICLAEDIAQGGYEKKSLELCFATIQDLENNLLVRGGERQKSDFSSWNSSCFI